MWLVCSGAAGSRACVVPPSLVKRRRRVSCWGGRRRRGVRQWLGGSWRRAAGGGQPDPSIGGRRLLARRSSPIPTCTTITVCGYHCSADLPPASLHPSLLDDWDLLRWAFANIPPDELPPAYSLHPHASSLPPLCYPAHPRPLPPPYRRQDWACYSPSTGKRWLLLSNPSPGLTCLTTSGYAYGAANNPPNGGDPAFLSNCPAAFNLPPLPPSPSPPFPPPLPPSPGPIPPSPGELGRQCGMHPCTAPSHSPLAHESVMHAAPDP